MQSNTVLRRLYSPSSIALITTNIIAAVIAVKHQWNLAEMLWLFWAQSIIIGILFAKKMWDQTNIPFKKDGRVQYDKKTKQVDRYLIAFFIGHYGFFHGGYALFLFGLSSFPTQKIGMLILLFFLNHLFSYFYHKKEDRTNQLPVVFRMFIPYARVVPMHIMLLSATVVGVVPLVIFLGLKTIADVGMHALEHKNK